MSVVQWEDLVDMFGPTEEDLWNELLLSEPMRSTCANCGEFRDGPATEVRDWFKTHALEAHGIKVRGGKVGKKMLKYEKATAEQKAKALAARSNLRLSNANNPTVSRARGIAAQSANAKWNRATMIAARDSFIAEHGRRPSSKMTGVGLPGRNTAIRVFGGWVNYMEAK